MLKALHRYNGSRGPIDFAMLKQSDAGALIVVSAVTVLSNSDHFLDLLPKVISLGKQRYCR